MAKAHDRILELNVTLDAGGNTLAVDSIKYYRTRGDTGFTLTGSVAAAVSGVEVAVGETVPPPTHIRFNFADF